MKKVYVDNSSTSFPKAPGVSNAMKDFLDNACCNINRGGYKASYDAALKIIESRKLLCEIFNFNNPKNVIFTPGITYSLNMILKGFLKDGEHVITTSMEHNGVMRVLHDLSQNKINYDIAKCGIDGSIDVNSISKLINSKTKAVVMTHASNVCGTILSIHEVVDICAKNNLKLIVDSAQTAGILDVDMSYIDALAFTCHKGLLASQGLGGFIVKSDMAEEIRPIMTGGTGSLSHEIFQPDFLPDKFEFGTLNIPAILGLKKSIEYIKSIGIKNIFERELELTKLFLSKLESLDAVKIIGKENTDGRLAVISLDFAGKDNAEIAASLDENYGIMTRCGLHCAPNAHKTLGTYPHGTIRFSFGHLNTADEVEYIVHSIKDILKRGV